ncbi:uncharacterized protein LOC123919893 [Trifolium pratense]|uniref:uncharacterized protein LOC123919893 n=1 Tax=Trifolium pratense TaxID=57577 RepID=UPI0008448119|nr:uncharacterized protein LOC123919893 [Trifolium pratense]
MDNQQRSPLLTWAYFCQGKSMEELKQSLMYTTMELEQTRATVQEELRKRDEQLLNLKEILNKVIRERDEAQEKCQRLFLEKLLFQQKQNQDPLSGISSIEDDIQNKRGIETSNNNGLSSSDCEESIVSSPQQIIVTTEPTMMIDLIAKDKPLPEKGKLLQAVMKAGPLLQTLLLAGPLPQWRHPPPPLESFEIPPVTIPSPPSQQQQFLHQDSSFVNSNCGRFSNRKRVFCEGSDSGSAENKYQRIVLH